jgi:hypothetical protein
MRNILIFVISGILLCSGCAAYKEAKWTPDTFNYTASFTHRGGELTHYVGVSWNLKP